MTSAAKTAATMMKPAAIRKRSSPRLVMMPTLSADVRPRGLGRADLRGWPAPGCKCKGPGRCRGRGSRDGGGRRPDQAAACSARQIVASPTSYSSASSAIVSPGGIALGDLPLLAGVEVRATASCLSRSPRTASAPVRDPHHDRFQSVALFCRSRDQAQLALDLRVVQSQRNRTREPAVARRRSAA